MSLKILLVDDSEIARKELARPLAEKGFTVYEADNGQDALDKIQEYELDLIVTDIHMPVMNGLELCEALHASTTISKKPPILVVSTESNPEMKTRGKAAGVKGWVIKPVDAEKLAKVAQMLIAKEEGK